MKKTESFVVGYISDVCGEKILPLLLTKSFLDDLRQLFHLCHKLVVSFLYFARSKCYTINLIASEFDRNDRRTHCIYHHLVPQQSSNKNNFGRTRSFKRAHFKP